MVMPVSSRGRKATAGAKRGWVFTVFSSDKDQRIAATASSAAQYRTGT